MSKNWKKIGKIVLIVFGILLLVASGIIGFFYYQFQGKYDVNEEKYAHSIGYLEPPKEMSKFQRCDDNRTYGWFASAATYGAIFKGDKPVFKKYIQENFKRVDSTENGFLNLRFIINCKGEVGCMEINELDSNYESTELSKGLVTQLVQLSSRKENWEVPLIKDEKMDSYMYLIFKIKNGKISEILP